MKNKAIFLSHPIANDMPLYGGSSDIKITQSSSILSGDTANSLKLLMPNHAGTHLDVPFHFYQNGRKLTEYLPSDWIFQNPTCVDIGEIKEGYLIDYQDVSKFINDKNDLLLIRTGFEKYRDKVSYWQKNPGLSENLAKKLRTKHPNIRAVGVDVISITSRLNRQEGRKAHLEFLGSHYDSSPIVLIEDMSLESYSNKISTVIIAPLLISDADGAPCTVFAW